MNRKANSTKIIGAVLLCVGILCISPSIAASGTINTLHNQNTLSKHPSMAPLLANGEWIEQASGFWEPSRGLRYLDAVNDNVAWAVAYDGSGSGQMNNEYTRTINGGDLWEANDVLGGNTYGLGNICGLDGDIAYVALFNGAGAQDDTCGVYKTTDGGASWTHLTGALQGAESFANNVYFWDENVGIALGDTRDGYFEDYTTTDGGITWNRVPQTNFSGVPLQTGEAGWTGVMDVVGDTVIFGTNKGNVCISNDRGNTYVASYTGASTSGTNAGVNAIAFKDSMHGLAGHDSGVSFDLFETTDGGATWNPITPTGTVYSNDLAYNFGLNMYVTTGAATGAYGASYSFDDGHTWVVWDEMINTQMLACDFVESGIGWAGGFNTDDVTGGMFKYLPGEPEPQLVIDTITGGKGVFATIKNVGTGEATDVDWSITIEGALILRGGSAEGTIASLLSGASNDTDVCTVFGFGLGILIFKPKITVSATCAEGATASKTIDAKVIGSTVKI